MDIVCGDHRLWVGCLALDGIRRIVRPRRKEADVRCVRAGVVTDLRNPIPLPERVEGRVGGHVQHDDDAK